MAAAPAASSAVGGATGASAKKKVFRMRGYLKKLGQKGLGKWRKRYFKRDGDKLYYFIDQDDLKHHGLIDLLQMTSADLIGTRAFAVLCPVAECCGSGRRGRRDHGARAARGRRARDKHKISHHHNGAHLRARSRDAAPRTPPASSPIVRV